jgi:ATP-binding cassette subfamily C protein
VVTLGASADERATETSLWEALRALLRLAPRRTAGILVLLVAVGLTEGVGVLLLVPLLGLVGLDVGAGALGGLERAVAALFGTLGLEITLVGVLVTYALVVGLRLVLARWRDVATARLQAETTARLQTDLFSTLVRTRWSELSNMRGPSFVHALTQEAARIGWALHELMLLASQIALTTVYGLLALHLAPSVVLLAFACGCTLVLALRGMHRRTKEAGEGISREASAFQGVVNEFLGGAKTIRAHGRGDSTSQTFADLARRLSALQVDVQKSSADARAVFEMGVVLLLCAVVYVSLELLATPTATLLLVLFLFARMLRLVGSIQQYAQSLISNLPAWATLGQLQAACEAAREDVSVAEEARSHEAPVTLEHDLRLEGVSFRYPGGKAALSGVDIAIPAGQTTALVGPSGGGKTTVADLAAGLLEPEAGRVLIDGRPLDAALRCTWRDSIGYVTQEPFLFRDTIAANLRWARPDANPDELREALELADAWEFVSALPEGLDTRLGDRGQTLSGGQRQRLSLARSLLRKPALLLLDEATSNLDAESERRILAAIDALHGRTTILIVAHRLSTARGADTIHVLEAGRVVERGGWQALIADEASRLSALCRTQGLQAT